MSYIQPANDTYHNLLRNILQYGNDRGDRTGTGTRSLFGEQVKFDLTRGFPLITTKKLHFKSIVHELLWMISGSTNIRYLQENGVRIWNEWADENGDLGPVYGDQWRHWEVNGDHYDHRSDQLKNVIARIRDKPEDRRLIVTAWNPGYVDQMKLPPCHLLYQFYVRNGFLDCHMFQRSADVFLGVPFNIAQYALLMHLVGEVTNLIPGILTISFGDVHIYNNHREQVEEQLGRDTNKFHLPDLNIVRTIDDIDDFKYEDIQLLGYEAYPNIKGEVAV